MNGVSRCFACYLSRKKRRLRTARVFCFFFPFACRAARFRARRHAKVAICRIFQWIVTSKEADAKAIGRYDTASRCRPIQSSVGPEFLPDHVYVNGVGRRRKPRDLYLPMTPFLFSVITRPKEKLDSRREASRRTPIRD